MILQRKETSLELPETMNIKNLVNSERSSPQSLPLWLTLYGNKSVSFTKLDFYCCITSCIRYYIILQGSRLIMLLV